MNFFYIWQHYLTLGFQVWSVATKSALKTLPNILPKSNDVPNSSSMCSLKFSKCGKWLAIPSEQTVVVLCSTDTWEKVKEVKIAGLGSGEIVTSTDWDNEGEYLIAGTNKVFLSALMMF